MARLPIPGSDDNTWGNVLNDFLLQAHNDDGTLQDDGIVGTKASDDAVVHNSQDETVDGVKTFTSSPVAPLPTTGSQVATKAYADSLAAAGAPDATSGTKGILQLSGDLGGTATTPTVPGLSTKEPTLAAGTTAQYYRGDKSWQSLDKSAVGLANVDNTSDADKPISTATQGALDAKVSLTGDQSIDGIKTFQDSPIVPTPLNATDAASKSYVDSAVTSSGALSARTIQLMTSDPNGAALTTGTGKIYWTASAQYNGYKVTDIQASVTTQSTAGLPTVQVTNVTTSAALLSTPVTIDANEPTSYTAATPSVINTANNTLATGNQLRVDVTAAGTGTKGLIVLITASPP